MSTDPWTALLHTATQPTLPKKHLIICGEPTRGKRTLLRGLINKSSSHSSSIDVFPEGVGGSGFLGRNRGAGVASGGGGSESKTVMTAKQGKQATEGKENEGPLRLDVLDDPRLKPCEGLLLGYEYIDISPSESDRIPPLSVYTTPSSEPLSRRILEKAIPREAVAGMGVVVVLDWRKPQTMLEELIRWLSWIEEWTTEVCTSEERIAGRERLQYIIQHYNDTPHDNPSMPDVVLPLDPETLVHNACGIPITIVITHTDTIHSTGSALISRGLVSSKGYSGRSAAEGEETEAYLAGMGWEERVEWVMQVVRTVALRYGASVIHTSTAILSTFQTLRAQILHSLYTTPNPPLQTPPTTKFPPPYPVNALDRDKLFVPTGWDSAVRIRVLREGFDVARVGGMWDDELGRRGKRERKERVEAGRGLRDLWRIVIPTPETESHVSRPLVTCENEQSFLSRQLEYTLRHPTDRTRSFRPPLTPRPGSSSTTTNGTSAKMIREALQDGTMPLKPVGVVGPVASGGLGMPSVEAAVARMEGDEPEPTPAVPATSNELLNNFFQGLIAGRRTPGSTPVKE